MGRKKELKGKGKKKPVLYYRIEEDGKFHLDVDGSGRYGLQFSTYADMRKAVKGSYVLKKSWGPKDEADWKEF